MGTLHYFMFRNKPFEFFQYSLWVESDTDVACLAQMLQELHKWILTKLLALEQFENKINS